MFHGFMLLVVEAHNESLCILLLGQDKSSQEVLRVFTASLDLFRGGGLVPYMDPTGGEMIQFDCYFLNVLKLPTRSPFCCSWLVLAMKYPLKI